MKSDDFNSQIRETRILLSILARVSEHSVERRLNGGNFPVSGLQLGVLRTIMREEQTISDLSRIFVLDPSTLVPVVDALERKGLVVRKRDPKDRRRLPLTLTVNGMKLVASIPSIDDSDPLHHGLKTMGTEQTGTLLDHLRILMKTLPNGEAILDGVEARLAHGAHEPGEDGALSKHEGGPKCWGLQSHAMRRRPYQRRRSGTD